MKKLLIHRENFELGLISLILVGVLSLLLFVVRISDFIIPLRLQFLGEVPLGNFDGVYYILISQNGYGAYQQAFFPLFPILIRGVTDTLKLPAISSGLLIVNVSLFFFLFIFTKDVKKTFGQKAAIWSAIFYILFPTGFFLGAIYTESLFLALSIASIYYYRRDEVLLASIFGCLASATRIVGVFLFPVFLLDILIRVRQKKIKIKQVLGNALKLFIIPAGTFAYMLLLQIRYNDALLFLHVQPAFGAGRSGGHLIFIPQVLWRYLKIISSAQYGQVEFFIACLELAVFIGGFIAILLAWRKKVPFVYTMFSFLSLFFPTLSGTLSSMPRYSLAAFAIFIYLGLIESKLLKIALIIIFFTLEIVLSAFFFRGYFVS